MKIRVVAVGKVKERFYEDAIAEYGKRLSRYCKLELVQVADEKTPDGASPVQESRLRRRRGSGFSPDPGRGLCDCPCH